MTNKEDLTSNNLSNILILLALLFGTDVLVIDDSDNGEGDAPHGTVVEKYQRVERKVAPQKPTKTDGKLDGVSKSTPLVTVLEIIGTFAIVFNVMTTLSSWEAV